MTRRDGHYLQLDKRLSKKLKQFLMRTADLHFLKHHRRWHKQEGISSFLNDLLNTTVLLYLHCAINAEVAKK